MSDNQQYHHGDLRNKLLALSHKMLQEGGLKGLSLRKLAERAGVSRTALYHHFNNKNDLLAAVAEQGFESLTCQLKSAVGAKDKSIQERLEQTVQCYLRFAMDNVTQYELMFGRELWRDHPSERLQRTAKDCLRSMMLAWMILIVCRHSKARDWRSGYQIQLLKNPCVKLAVMTLLRKCVRLVITVRWTP